MSDIKCPFCQQKLEEKTFFHGRVLVFCTNPNCIIFDWGGCSKQIITKLIRTRKALETAVDALKMIGSGDIIEHSVVGHEDDNKIFIANKVLEQITTLEQKDKPCQ